MSGLGNRFFLLNRTLNADDELKAGCKPFINSVKVVSDIDNIETVMQLSLDTGLGKYHIKAYQPGQITVNEAIITHSIIITPQQLIDPWPVSQFATLQSPSLDYFLKAITKPEVILLGTGEQLQFPKPELLLPLTSQGIGVEVMNTSAACRTYNVLMSEGRNVAAGLIIEIL